jgi:hypothetical protein
MKKHHLIGGHHHFKYGGSKNRTHGTATKVRSRCLLRRHQSRVQPPGSGFPAGTIRTAEAKILNVLELFGPLESNPQELTTVDGTSLWAGDGVHLTSNAARVAARKMMAYFIGGETAEPASKRARLESVIPVRSTAPLPAKPAPPPPPKPVPPPLWLSGQLPANQRGNTNPRGQLRGGRGNNPQRGGQQGQTRTVPPRGGNRGGPRGGRPGRWGRWRSQPIYFSHCKKNPNVKEGLPR